MFTIVFFLLLQRKKDLKCQEIKTISSVGGGDNTANVVVENNNISVVGALAGKSNLHCVAVENCFILTYNNTTVIDHNRDFLIDYIKMPDGRKYIQINGKYVPVVSIDFKNFSAALPDGRILFWKNNRWQEEQKHVPHGKECRNR